VDEIPDLESDPRGLLDDVAFRVLDGDPVADLVGSVDHDVHPAQEREQDAQPLLGDDRQHPTSVTSPKASLSTFRRSCLRRFDSVWANSQSETTR
jgi:hypothetical protein